jgi:hypothetical protein
VLLTNLQYNNVGIRNSDSDGRDDGQMTFLNLNSYVQNLHFFRIPDRRTDEWTDGRTDGRRN